jgi:H+/Cl- antiporter ClcA
MIHSGAVVAAGLSQGKNSSFNVDGCWARFHSFRNDHEKRDFVACGTAAGVAAAFGAPIGGCLFALEEGTTHWNDFLTWRTFVCAMVSAATLNFTLSIFETKRAGLLDQKGSITFGSFHTQDAPYTAQELPIFILLGAIGGAVGAMFNQLNKIITIKRKKYVVPHKLRNVLEALIIAMAVSVLSFGVAYLNRGSCVEKTRFEETRTGQMVGLELEAFTSFYCPKGKQGQDMVNDYALLFFQPAEDTIKMLFHSEQDLGLPSLLTFIFIYFFLACLTYGIAVPSGLFVPSLLLGAGMGRLYGEVFGMILEFYGHPFAISKPGVYALIGAAGMLGGMARMTISITVIMIEATNDYSYGLPLMLALITARWVGNLFNHGLYDIHIHLNKVPLLESEALVGPWEQTRAQDVLLAQDIMSPCGRGNQLEDVRAPA